MRTVASLLLALTLPSTTLAAVPVKLRPQSVASRAATTRIAERKIPKLVKHAKPKLHDISTLMPAMPAVTKPIAPAPSNEPTLTAEELAVEVVDVTPRALHSPQIGTWHTSWLATFGPYTGFWLRPDHNESISFASAVSWITGHSLLVECAGTFSEPMAVSYTRSSMTKGTYEELGKLVVDLEGEDLLAFVVPAAKLDGWERLVVTIVDADAKGPYAVVDKCTFTRL